MSLPARYEEWRPFVRRAWSDSPFLVPLAIGLVVLLAWKAPCFGMLWAGVASGVASRVRAFSTRRRLRLMRDLPAPVDQIPVHVTLSRLFTYGTDDGLLSVVDGWLVFEGDRTRFAVSSADVEPADEGFSFAFAAPGGVRWATLEPLDKDALTATWQAWQRAQRPPEGGNVLFPPSTPRPGTSVRGYVWGALMWSTLAVLIVADFLFRIPIYWGSVATVLVVSIFGVAALGLRAAAGAEELRRLERGQPMTRRLGLYFSGSPVDYLRWRASWAKRRRARAALPRRR